MSEYLRARINGGKLPFTASIPWGSPIVRNSQNQWITEVETWFMKSVLNSVLYVQNGARIRLGTRPIGPSMTVQSSKMSIICAIEYFFETAIIPISTG
jgi:hypothetical protein